MEPKEPEIDYMETDATDTAMNVMFAIGVIFIIIGYVGVAVAAYNHYA